MPAAFRVPPQARLPRPWPLVALLSHVLGRTRCLPDEAAHERASGARYDVVVRVRPDVVVSLNGSVAWARWRPFADRDVHYHLDMFAILARAAADVYFSAADYFAGGKCLQLPAESSEPSADRPYCHNVKDARGHVHVTPGWSSQCFLRTLFVASGVRERGWYATELFYAWQVRPSDVTRQEALPSRDAWPGRCDGAGDDVRGDGEGAAVSGGPPSSSPAHHQRVPVPPRRCEARGCGPVAPPVDVASKLEYLPELAQVASLGDGTLRVGFFDPAAFQLMRDLERTMNPQSCNGTLRVGYWNSGFASAFHYLLVQLKRALQLGRAVDFVVAGTTPTIASPQEQTGAFLWGAFCSSRDLQCIFEPFGRCGASAAARASLVRAWRAEVGSKSIREYRKFIARPDVGGLAFNVRQPDAAPRRVPPAYRGRSVFWLVSLLAGFLFRPRREFAQHAAALRDQLKLVDGRYIALHVRRGDSCNDQVRLCQPADSFVQPLMRIREMYGLRRVYVATDAPHVVGELMRALPSLEFVTQPLLASNSSAQIEQRLQHSPPEHVALLLREILSDVLLLADAAAFVGGFTSNAFRLAFELSFFRKGAVAPFISTDIAWCFGGMQWVHVKGRNGTKYFPRKFYGC